MISSILLPLRGDERLELVPERDDEGRQVLGAAQALLKLGQSLGPKVRLAAEDWKDARELSNFEAQARENVKSTKLSSF